jgi:hypothetical protein
MADKKKTKPQPKKQTRFEPIVSTKPQMIGLRLADPDVDEFIRLKCETDEISLNHLCARIIEQEVRRSEEFKHFLATGRYKPSKKGILE